MASGVPVVTSYTSAIPEVAGEGAILVDPANPDAIAQSLVELDENPAHYENQGSYGMSRSKQFSWDQTGRNIKEIYLSI